MRLWWRQRIALRELETEDARDLARLHALAFQRGWSEDEFEQLLAAATSLGDAAVLSTGGAVQGFVLSRIALPEAEILSIVVEPSARRYGMGRRLFSHHLDRLRGQGVRELFLEVDEGNEPALAFYDKFGLKRVGQRSGYYPRASGGRGGALVLRLDLE